MLKGLEIPSLIQRTLALGLLIFLCLAQTVWATESAGKLQNHSATEEKSLPAANEKIATVLETTPLELLSELTKSLGRAKSDMSQEDFDKLVDEAMKKVAANEDSKENERVAREAADKLKKVFEEEKENLGSESAEEVRVAVADELTNRAKKPAQAASEKPPVPANANPVAEENPEVKKPLDPKLEDLKKQLADFQDKIKKTKTKLEKDKDDAKLNDLLKGLATRGNKNSGLDEPSDRGNSTQSPTPSSNEPDKEEKDEPFQDINPSAGEKLRALADLLKGSTENTDTSPSTEDESENSKSLASSKKDNDTSSASDLPIDSPADTESDPPAVETAAQPNLPAAEQPFFGPPSVPAKAALPMIANSGGGFSNAPIAQSGSANSSPSMFGGNGGGASMSGQSSNGFSDMVFNGLGGFMTAAKRITYKYLRSGAEAFGPSSGASSDSDANENAGSSSYSPTKASLQGGAIFEFPENTSEHQAGLDNQRGIFNYLSDRVAGLCLSGSLTCHHLMEKQP